MKTLKRTWLEGLCRGLDPDGDASPEGGTLSFRDFVTRVRPGYRWYWHCEALAAVLQRVADGELKRVLVFMPPRHGKSELVSRLFTAYYLYRYPHRWVGLCSYGADLAETLARAAQANYVRSGGKLRGGSTAVKHWEVPQGGGMWAAGVGGPITGKGFHCFDGNTLISTPSGRMTIRSIVKSGRPTEVYSFNHGTGRVEVKAARWMARLTSDSVVRIRVNGETIEATPEHPFYVVGRGYVPAIAIKAGDKVLCLRRGFIGVMGAVLSTVASRVGKQGRRAISVLSGVTRTIARCLAPRSRVSSAGPR